MRPWGLLATRSSSGVICYAAVNAVLARRCRYGTAAEKVQARTSIVPLAAILDGRQKLPKDYYKEFLRGPYLVLIPFCIGAYLCHPLMQRASYWLGW